MTNTLKLALAAVALSAAPAIAAADEDRKTAEVNYADLDLSTAQGVKELDARIHRAAEDVCGMDRTTTGTRIQSREARKCYKQAKGQMDRHFAQIKRDANLGG